MCSYLFPFNFVVLSFKQFFTFLAFPGSVSRLQALAFVFWIRFLATGPCNRFPDPFPCYRLLQSVLDPFSGYRLLQSVPDPFSGYRLLQSVPDPFPGYRLLQSFPGSVSRLQALAIGSGSVFRIQALAFVSCSFDEENKFDDFVRNFLARSLSRLFFFFPGANVAEPVLLIRAGAGSGSTIGTVKRRNSQ